MLAALLGLASASLLLLLVVIAGLVYVATSCNGGRLAALFGIGLAILVVLRFSYAGTQVRATRPLEWGGISAKISGPQTQFGAGLPQASTQQMWAHLTRPRIVLDGEQQDSAEQSVVGVAREASARPTHPAAAQQPARQEGADAAHSKSQHPESQRPSWVDRAPKRVGNVYRVVVASGPYQTEAECYQSLEPELEKVVRQRIRQLMPGGTAAELGQPSEPGHRLDPGPGADLAERAHLGELGIGMDSVWRDICTEAWVETSEASFGEMKQVYVLMQFGAAQDAQILQAARNYQRTGRIARVGTIAGAIVAGLIVLYGLLAADTATKGYYSKRLFFGVPAAIIILILLALS